MSASSPESMVCVKASDVLGYLLQWLLGTEPGGSSPRLLSMCAERVSGHHAASVCCDLGLMLTWVFFWDLFKGFLTLTGQESVGTKAQSSL